MRALKSKQLTTQTRVIGRVPHRASCARSQPSEQQLLLCHCLSVRPHGTIRFPLDGFSWNLVSKDTSKTCREHWSLILKSDQNNGNHAWRRSTFMARRLLLSMRNASNKVCRENQSTRYVMLCYVMLCSTNFSRKLCRLWDIVGRHRLPCFVSTTAVLRERTKPVYYSCSACLVTHTHTHTHIYIYKLNSVALVRERTIPTERPPPVGEVSVLFCG